MFTQIRHIPLGGRCAWGMSCAGGRVVLVDVDCATATAGRAVAQRTRMARRKVMGRAYPWTGLKCPDQSPKEIPVARAVRTTS